MNEPVTLLLVVLATALSCGAGCRPAADAAGSQETMTRPVSVNVLTATKTTMERTTTQPATVHAYYEAHVFAKAAGYLTELNVDIGTNVKSGDVLAVLSVPEMARQREAQLATIRRLEADERRAASQLAVAKASIGSYQAKRDQAKAEVGKAEAGLAAARVELQRATDLVEQRAVADRLQDEAQKKHDAAAAETNRVFTLPLGVAGHDCQRRRIGVEHKRLNGDRRQLLAAITRACNSANNDRLDTRSM